jgi:hypothetical protein
MGTFCPTVEYNTGLQDDNCNEIAIISSGNVKCNFIVDHLIMVERYHLMNLTEMTAVITYADGNHCSEGV